MKGDDLPAHRCWWTHGPRRRHSRTPKNALGNHQRHVLLHQTPMAVHRYARPPRGRPWQTSRTPTSGHVSRQRHQTHTSNRESWRTFDRQPAASARGPSARSHNPIPEPPVCQRGPILGSGPRATGPQETATGTVWDIHLIGQAPISHRERWRHSACPDCTAATTLPTAV